MARSNLTFVIEALPYSVE